MRFLPESYFFLHCCDSLFPKLYDCLEVSGNEEGLIKEKHKYKIVHYIFYDVVYGMTNKLVNEACKHSCPEELQCPDHNLRD